MRDSFLKNPFVFATIICVFCSFVLSLCAEGLRERIAFNVKIDVERKILESVGITKEDGRRLSSERVEELFNEKLRFIAVDDEGNVDDSVTPEQIREETVADRYALYALEENEEIQAYVVPMKGAGLWGPISGYLALEPDCTTVRGVTFSTKMETPGLGAEIATESFQDQFVGKQTLDEQGTLVSIDVVKGKAEEVASDRIDHAVDGVSGATITSDGVTDMIEKWLAIFEPYFEKVRQA